MQAPHVTEVTLLQSNSANAGVLAWLARRTPHAPASLPPDAVARPCDQCGAHPDIVDRLWDRIGTALPGDCRRLVHGAPALVQPDSGMVLGVAIGMQYALRVAGSRLDEAISRGAKTSTVWSGGAVMNLRESFGNDWIFGGWLADEPAWCAEAYDLAAADSR